MKYLIDKFYNAKLSTHFLIWYLFIFGILVGSGYLIGGDHMMNFIKASSLISAAISGLITLMMATRRDADAFYKRLEAIEQQAKEVITAKELAQLRKDLTDHWKESSCSYMDAECHKVGMLIDTRLRYEFKIQFQ